MGTTGYKTENRRRILEYLIEHANVTVSVKEIYDYLAEHNCSVNLTTIYRFLNKLEEEGRVIPYHSEKGDKTTYQYVADEHHCTEHLHLKCTKCGKIVHLDCQFMSDIATHIAKNHDFAIQCKNSIIYGECKQCREKEN